MTFLASAMTAGGTAAAASTAVPALSSGALSLAAKGSLLQGSVASSIGSSILGMLSNPLNLASAGLSLFAGDQSAGALNSQMMMNARSLEQQAKDDELDAETQVLAGKRDANDITESMVRTISNQRLAFAANGLDPSFGTPLAVEETTRNIAEKQISTTRSDAQLRAVSRRRQAQERLLDRSNTIISGTSSIRSARMQGYSSALGALESSYSRGKARG